MSRPIASVALLAVLIGVGGCTTSRKIVSRSELAYELDARPITVYTQDHRVYALRGHTLADSVLRGLGTVQLGLQTAPYNGGIPLDSIVAITADSRNVMKGLIVLGATIVFVVAVSDHSHPGDGLSETEQAHQVSPVTGSGGSSMSCPYVYAWNGKQYVFEAEPFGTSWGRGLERTTFHLLPSAKARNGLVRLRLANERQETQYVNSLSVFAIELGAAPAAVLDGDGTAWPLVHPQPPVTASEESGRDVRAALAAVDGRMWECDPANLAEGSGYEDVLQLAFPRPHRAPDGTFVLTGVNTTLSAAIHEHLCRLVGNQAVALEHAVETDPELIASLEQYLDDASLKASVWNGEAWKAAGVIRPEANAVAFTRGLRIRVPGGAGDTVRIRLRSMADVWKIDGVAMDWSDASPLAMTPLPLVSAAGPEGEDLSERLGANDSRYAILLPPDRVELRFAAARQSSGTRVAYAVAARGYLHEWVPKRADAGITTPASMVPAERRIDLLKELLQHRELALRPVYEAWAQTRSR